LNIVLDRRLERGQWRRAAAHTQSEITTTFGTRSVHISGWAASTKKAMMELMGHKRPEMTMRYTHLSLDYKRAAVGKLPAFGDIKSGSESPQISPSAEEPKVVNFRN
jgi:hypothetical protein